MKVVIIDYNAGNTQSVIFALQRLGIQPILSYNKEIIKTADKVILPGVGHAAAAMEALKERKLDVLIPELKQPFLGICLGQQLLCRHSEEGNTGCLGVFDIDVQVFPPTDKVPHMGWNNVFDMRTELFKNISQNEYFYHVHSYFVPVNEYNIATCNYIFPFATAMNKENFYSTQFHPEKSGKAGEMVLKNFIEI